MQWYRIKIKFLKKGVLLFFKLYILISSILWIYFIVFPKSVLYVLPTGGGKTVIFSHIAEQAAIKGNRVCILVHRSELVDQSSESLSKIGVEHGVITAGKELDLSKTVQVVSKLMQARPNRSKLI